MGHPAFIPGLLHCEQNNENHVSSKATLKDDKNGDNKYNILIVDKFRLLAVQKFILLMPKISRFHFEFITIQLIFNSFDCFA